MSGTLAAALLCAARAGDALSQAGAKQGRNQGGNRERDQSAKETPAAAASRDWGLLVMGDAPGFMSLVARHPSLAGRVVHTNDAGVTGHTSFSASCAEKGHTSCTTEGTVDPGGGWTRSMIDLYLGGLADGFVSVLFSSFVGAVTGRSLTCCSERHHYGAMYTQQHSHRDRPMRNVQFLQALMQSVELQTEVAHWPP